MNERRTIETKTVERDNGNGTAHVFRVGPDPQSMSDYGNLPTDLAGSIVYAYSSTPDGDNEILTYGDKNFTTRGFYLKAECLLPVIEAVSSKSVRAAAVVLDIDLPAGFDLDALLETARKIELAVA